MAKLSLCIEISTVAFTLAASALAQDAPAADASGSVSVSTEEGATAVATPPAVEEPAAAAAAEPYEPYEPGYPPEGHTLELGIFGGLLLPSPIHNLRNENYAHRKFGPGIEAGARLGYYPLSWFGLEGEAMGAGASVKNSNNQVVLYGFRAFGVLQAPTPYITPFLVVGGGRMGAVSRATGNDGDQGFLFGLGAKIPFNHAIGLRVDMRDNLLPHVHVGRGQTHNLEILLGLSATIGRTRKELPPPAADTDRDGFVDTADRCPSDVGVAPEGCPADTDTDGVLDRDDYCPREAGPAPKGCPVVDLDPDKDNVPLPCDVCPNEAGVAPDGCPVRDSDGDGIPDDKDKCPKEAETRNGFEDADGCPDKLPDVVKKFTGVIQGIYFDQGKATIRAASTRTLSAASKVLQDHPSIGIEITGHTSSEGELSFNQQLSQDRADSVKAWLVEQGVDSTRITTRGAGPSEPIADNATAGGREKNRRIEFKIKQ